MRLLMLTHRFPCPPTRGDAIRAWGWLSGLAERHDVWLACVDRRPPAPEHLAEVRRRCRDVFVAARGERLSLLRGALSLARGRSLTEGYFADRRLADVVRRWAERVGFQGVLTFSSAMAPYAALIPGARRVLDMNDVDSFKWSVFADRSRPPLRWVYRLEARRLEAAERRGARLHDVCVVVNGRERDRLHERIGDVPCAVVHTALRLTELDDRQRACAANPPGADAPGARCPKPEQPVADGPVVGMVGSMCYRPNVEAVDWFGRNVWPLIARAHPTARWLIVGSRPARRVRRWGRQPRVTVTGFVPDVRPWLRSMRVVVNAVAHPLGVQTKLIEALAAGRACVVTSAAAGGIEFGVEPPFIVADEPQAFAGSVLRLLSDDALRARLAQRARRLAKTHYELDDQLRRLEQHLKRAPTQRPELALPSPVRPPREGAWRRPVPAAACGAGR